MMSLLLDLARLFGNPIVKIIFPSGFIEEDSLLSDIIGIFSIMGIVAIMLWTLVEMMG